jgi:hypothetical protein
LRPVSAGWLGPGLQRDACGGAMMTAFILLPLRHVLWQLAIHSRFQTLNVKLQGYRRRHVNCAANLFSARLKKISHEQLLSDCHYTRKIKI